MTTNYTHLSRLAKARAVVSLFGNMTQEDAQAVAGLLAGIDEAEDECGITRQQRLRMIDIMEADVPGTVLAADLAKIITDNHGVSNELARAAAGIDLLQALRDVERLVRINENMTADILRSKSHKDHFAAANAAIFRLREIGRVVTPLVALLEPGAGNGAQAVAAE